MKQVLIIGFVWPEPKSSAAGSRMMQLIHAFLSNNYNVTFATATTRNENAFPLESIGVEVQPIELNSESFNVFIKELQPNVVLFDRFLSEEQFGWRVTEQCPDALKILDTEDLHGLRKGRQQAFKDNVAFDTTYLFNDTAKREIASIYRCDLSLIISEAEMEILKTQFKVDDSLLLYLPFMLDEISEETIRQLPNFEERQHFITIGNFLHEPNYNSVLYLKETIWPLIRKQLPNAELQIYGAYVSQKVTQLDNKKEGFLVKGFANDVNEVMQQAKVCLAPLQFGAGLKGKLVDAMQNGTPCVMSSIAAEGMFGEFEVNGFVEDKPQDFANQAISLYENKSLWQEKQLQGFDIINNRFNKATFQTQFINRVEAISKQLGKHRLHNFTGSMLQHQSMQSTKYMSKWIEAKNSK